MCSVTNACSRPTDDLSLYVYPVYSVLCGTGVEVSVLMKQRPFPYESGGRKASVGDFTWLESVLRVSVSAWTRFGCKGFSSEQVKGESNGDRLSTVYLEKFIWKTSSSSSSFNEQLTKGSLFNGKER